MKIALEVARDEQIGLLVFGANRKGLGKRYFRKAMKRIRDGRALPRLGRRVAGSRNRCGLQACRGAL